MKVRCVVQLYEEVGESILIVRMIERGGGIGLVARGIFKPIMTGNVACCF